MARMLHLVVSGGLWLKNKGTEYTVSARRYNSYHTFLQAFFQYEVLLIGLACGTINF